MREDFCAMILSHGRPDRVLTLNTMRRAGYTGRIYIVIDDEDETAPEYRRLHGDAVLQFSKSEVAKTFDIGDSIPNRRSVVYARNASFDLAESVGCRYFMQLDDDYGAFYIRNGPDGRYGHWRIGKTLDRLIEAMLEFFEATPILSIAMSQGGDHIGGGAGGGKPPRLLRKAMNTFLCSVDRRFPFFGRMNDDVNTVVNTGSRGGLFFTAMQAMIVQGATQHNSGGLTELYLEMGTYVKTFYSVLWNPSSVKVSTLSDHRGVRDNARIHHAIDWRRTVPCIIRQEHRRGRAK
jgi:hypothetical protein